MDSDLLEKLSKIDRDGPIRSHRRFLGRLIVPLKKRLGRFLQGALEPVLESQGRFNRAAAAEIRALGERAGAVGPLGKQPIPIGSGIEQVMRSLEKKVDLIHTTLLEEITSLEATLRRELEGRIEEEASRVRAVFESALAGRPPKSSGQRTAAARALEQIDHDRFLAQAPGPAEVDRDRYSPYLGLFEAHAPVLDVGCGRGGMLAFLASHSVEGWGVESSQEAVRQAQAAGLRVELGDPEEYVSSLPEGELSSIFSTRITGSLGPTGVKRFILLASSKLRPGGILVIETPNPLSLYSLTHHYLSDWIQRPPIPPDTLRFFFESAGLREVRSLFLAPVPDSLKLRPIPYDENLDLAMREALAAVNVAMDRLNAFLFAPQSYAVIGAAPGPRRSAGGTADSP